MLRQLVRRQLLALTKADDASPDSKPDLYVTTPRFLELFSLDSLSDLPAAEDLVR